MLFDMKKILTATLFIAVSLAAGCSNGITETRSGGPTGSLAGNSAGATSEPTPSASASTNARPETTVDTGTLESDPDAEPEVVLRVEGDSGVTFSGLCNVGEERTVLGGDSVPKRYAFDPGEERLSCKIQKQDPGGGDLKVTLLAGENTHSVQQTNSPDSAINVSYGG